MFDYMLSLILTVVGFVALVIARLTNRIDPITKRAYAKRYSGAPGADVESKPDAR